MTEEIILNGIVGSPGICIGQAYLVDNENLDIIKKYNIPVGEVLKEKERFKIAVERTLEDLKDTIKNIPETYKENANILDIYRTIAKDKMLYDAALEIIEKEAINSEWALKKVGLNIKKKFINIDDDYLKSRYYDIKHIISLILKQLSKTINNNDISKITKKVILVSKDISPAEVSQIQVEKVMGFITDLGNTTSHTSLFARNLQIPCLVGLKNSRKLILNEDIIIVDSLSGKLILNPSDESIIKYNQIASSYLDEKAELIKNKNLPAISKDNVLINLNVNIELPEEISSLIENGGEGVGLFRTEFLYLKKNKFPEEEELFELYKEILIKLAGKPLVFRTLDINGDKTIKSLKTIGKDEKNPALGLRSIRFCFKNLDIFKTQLRAILRAAKFGNVKIMFPFISSYNEVVYAKEILSQVKEDLKKEGIEFADEKAIGIMIEVPSAVLIANELSQIVDFFSIGTNDLIQYILAADRHHPDLDYLYSPLHPAVLRIMNDLSIISHKNRVDLQICGEMANDPINLPIILGLGIKSISTNAPAIPIIKNSIRNLSVGKSKEILKEVLQMKTTEEIKNLLTNFYNHL